VKELEITSELWNERQHLMNALWNTAREIDPNNVFNDSKHLIWRTHLNATWKIRCMLINKSYLRVDVSKNDVEILTIRYDRNVDKILNVVLLIVGATRN
jgi:hypothetical protein